MKPHCTFFSTGTTGINVFYTPDLDGGGSWFGQEYIEIIKKRYPARKFQHCLEWCSGPGFIGYSLLDHEICDTLGLMDVHAPAIEWAEETANHVPNRCRERVSTWTTGDISAIPASEKFDLVVANPPHFPFGVGDANSNRINADDGWKIHENFFTHIGQYLADDGIILLQENEAGSTIDTFRSMIESNGLKITDRFNSPNHYTPNNFTRIYYLEIVRA